MGDKRGAKTLLTKETAETIVKAVAVATPLKFAAAEAGISEGTLMTWLRKGRKGESPELVQFSQDIEKAKAQAVKTRLGRIRKAGRTTWQANAWLLERMHPEEFGTDKRLVASLLEQVTTLKAQLDVVNAHTRRNKPRRKPAGKANKPAVGGGSHI